MTGGPPQQPSQQQLNQNLTGQRIDNGALELVSIIGLGAYGVVYKALARDGRYYAVKCLNKTGLDSRQRSFQRREIALHTLASSHPNIVTLHNVIETSTCIYVVLAFCPDGDLFSQITEKSRYLGDDALIKDVFLQIVDAVEYCHRLGIYHRDLKPENILCDAKGAQVVLADFGLATAEKTSGDFGCGSTFYMSPECQGGLFQRLGSYSTLHNDIWSLGVILVNLTCGRNPWKQACPSDETFRAYLSNPDFLRSILPISKQCNELLKRIFALNPASRITIKELKAEVKRMGRWTMTLEELRCATRATKEAARAWAPAHIVDDPNDAPPAKAPQPQQPSTRHAPPPTHAPPQPTTAHSKQQPLPPLPHTHRAHPRPRPQQQLGDSLFETDNVRAAEKWKHHQQQLLQQQGRPTHVRPQLHQSPQQHDVVQHQRAYPPRPSHPVSPAFASSVEFLAPAAPVARPHTPSRTTAPPLHSDFSFSESGESSGNDEDEDMVLEYQGRHRQEQLRQEQHFLNQQSTPQRQRLQSPLHTKGQWQEYSNVRTPQQPKASPPPLTTSSPRTPRQLFASPHRPRKQSIESTSSSSSASSDASWTGLPPTPDTPMFTTKRGGAGGTGIRIPTTGTPLLGGPGGGGGGGATTPTPQGNEKGKSHLTSAFSIGAKLKLAF